MSPEIHESAPSETSPLLRQPSTSSLSSKSSQTTISDVPNVVENTKISVSRGVVITASLGLIIFLQGMLDLYLGRLSAQHRSEVASLRCRLPCRAADSWLSNRCSIPAFALIPVPSLVSHWPKSHSKTGANRDIACNFSLLTTTQSAIAADLDAFEDVTWFTSAYLVSGSPRGA